MHNGIMQTIDERQEKMFIGHGIQRLGRQGPVDGHKGTKERLPTNPIYAERTAGNKAEEAAKFLEQNMWFN